MRMRMRVFTFQKLLLVFLVLWAGGSITFFKLKDEPEVPNIQIRIPHRQPEAVESLEEVGERSVIVDPFPKQLAVTLLNWKRTESLRTIVSSLQRYDDFITEILIGNNNPDTVLTDKDFNSPKIALRVYNFPQNRLFYARYELCLMAEGQYCYFQDDDWENRHLRALYSNFLRFPHLLHTDTNAFVSYLTWAWSFFDPNVNMHSGFSWVGTGGIASKENVRRFTETQVPILPRDCVSLADMYFSTWFNQFPYQLENELIELENKFGYSSQEGGILKNKLHMGNGAKMLHQNLLTNSSIFVKEEQSPKLEERYTKSPCDNDDCLFMTSLHSFPSTRQIIYDPRWGIVDLERLHTTIFDYKLFIENPYHYAVDRSLETSWKSLSEIRSGDYFGLDLMQADKYSNIYVIVGHKYQLELSLDVSLDGNLWTNTTCDWIVETEDGATRYTIKTGCKNCIFRFVRFRTQMPYSLPIQVFDIHHTDKFNKWSVQKEANLTTCKISPKTFVPNIDSKPPLFLREIGNGEILVTLVLLNQNGDRLDSLKTILADIAQYQFFSEYIIWNNNPTTQITQADLFPSGVPAHASLRIINSLENIHDFARYMACSMASNRYCYLQDDDWLNEHIQSQYSQFLKYPELFHTLATPNAYLDHRRWNVYNSEVGLQSGFSWLRTGAFIPQAKAKKFLDQVSQIDIKSYELQQADIFFSYFVNDYPYELSANLRPLNQTEPLPTYADHFLSLAANLVLNDLKENQKIFPISNPNPTYAERDVRAPCSNDKCLFMTNIASVPNPDNVVFDGTKTIKEQEEVYNKLNTPRSWFWDVSSYERAVDGDPFTCFSSVRVAQAGDYFGLDLLHTNVYTKFTIVIDQDVSKFDLHVSKNGVDWEIVGFNVRQARLLAASIRSYSISIDYLKPFRFVRFAAQYEIINNNIHVSVYELFEGDISGTFVSFGANKALNPSFETPFTHTSAETDADWYIQHPDGDIHDFTSNLAAYSGKWSLRLESKDASAVISASQTVELYQKFPRKLIISAASKAENVISYNAAEAGYALVVDLAFMDGTAKWDAYVSGFSAGTHNWQVKIITINSETEIKTVTIHLFFKGHTGTVYFDDVLLQEEQW